MRGHGKIIDWVCETRPAVICVIGIVGCAAVSWLFLPATGAANAKLRICGLFLQLLGLLLIARGIRETRKIFGRPGLLERARGWWRRRPLFNRPRVVNISGVGGIGSAQAFGTASVGRAPNPNATVDERLALLETDVAQIRQQLGETRHELKSEIGAVRTETAANIKALTTADEQTKRLLESVSIGGIDLEIIGLVWLIVGVIAATAPDEILNMFGF